MNRQEIIAYFSDIMGTGNGIVGFISDNSSDYLFDVLLNIDKAPLTKVQFDQLLSLQHVQTMSDDFFRFYWLERPDKHFYEIDAIEIPEGTDTIKSLEQLKWGFNRIIIDTLYVYGNIQKGYETLCNLSIQEITGIFSKHLFNTSQIQKRGNTLHFEQIDRNDRYLISEMAFNSFSNLKNRDELINMLCDSYQNAYSQGNTRPSYNDLLGGKYAEKKNYTQTSMFPEYCYAELLEQRIESKEDLLEKSRELADRWDAAHKKALKNTELYLSLVSDLDVYVATSMRTKDNFMNMAKFCEQVFKSEELKEYDLRYFDPTISAADSHEDKGLIECLMVKSARMLIYQTGDRDSYGKDVEAAMALCLGKPTIFFCSDDQKKKFFKDVHPLSRLVNFESGVAGGLIACSSVEEVICIVHRLITNTMKYKIERKTPGSNYYLLKEEKTGSIVRIQTDNELLTSVFWNSYHKK